MKKKQEMNPAEAKGVSTKSYKPKKSAVKSQSKEAETPKRRLTKRSKIIIAAVAAMLCCAMIFGIVFAIVLGIEDKNFDYLGSDLSRYIEIADGDYKDGFDLNINLIKPRLKNSDGSGVSDVEGKILALLSSDIKNNVINSGASYKTGTVAVGDDVYIWYRGYTVRDGKQVDIIGLHNYYLDKDTVESEANVINVGSGIVPYSGFDASLVGKNTEDYAKFVKTTDRAAAAGDVVYISASRIPVGADASKEEKGSYVRIDLEDPSNSEWASVLVGRKPAEEIPDFNITVDGVEYTYKSTKIDFITECEKADNVLTVSAYVPNGYTGDVALIGETVYFDVFVEQIIYHNEWHNDESSTEYDISYDFNDAYVAAKIADGTLGLTAEELETYEGGTLTEKYESYVYEQLLSEYEKEYLELVEVAMWDYFFDVADIKQYPKSKVDEIYDKSVASLVQSYNDSEGYVYNKYTGYSQMCQSFDEYALIYLDLVYAENQDWSAKLYSDARDLVAERLIIYYILKKEDIVPSSEALAEKVELIKEEFLLEYIAMDNTDTSKYTEEQYDKYVSEIREKIDSGFSSDYFKERAYAKIALEAILPLANVKTLDAAAD